MSRGRGRTVADADEAPVGIRKGRWSLPFTQLPDWLLFAEARPPAKLLYWALACHLNPKADEPVVNPTMAQLADMLGYSRRDKLLTYFNELEALGAIDIETEMVPGRGWVKRNSYVVHQDPPEEYTGPTSLGEFHTARKARLRAEAAAREAAAARNRTPGGLSAPSADPEPVDNSPQDGPQTPVIPGLEAVPGDESAGGEPYPKWGTAAVPHLGYRPRTPFGERDNKTNKQDDWNKNEGAYRRPPEPPAVLTAGRVDHWVTSQTGFQGDQQTASAETCAAGFNSETDDSLIPADDSLIPEDAEAWPPTDATRYPVSAPSAAVDGLESHRGNSVLPGPAEAAVAVSGAVSRVCDSPGTRPPLRELVGRFQAEAEQGQARG